MPRKPRMYLPGIPAHVVQRGHNREACFFAHDDYTYYLEVLAQGCRRYDVAVHAYCLMTNHVHLLLTPAHADVGISQVMQHVGRLYVAYINRTYRHSGSLREGRHKASLVEADRYLLACYRYIELNPVAANMVQTPEQYRWSSYTYHARGTPDTLVTEHAIYTSLGETPEMRQRVYRGLFEDRLPGADIHDIRAALAFNHPLGNDRFRGQIERALGRSVGEKQRGRPRADLADNESA